MKIFFVIVLFTSCLLIQLQAQQPEGTIYFSKGKASLNAQSNGLLQTLTETIKKNKNSRVTIAGFADAQGDATSNLGLSKKRAITVSDYFTAHGIDKNTITVAFFGEEKPAGNYKNDLHNNRRVEVTIEFKKNSKEVFTGIYGKVWKKPVKHIFAASKVSSGEVLIVDGPEGTKVWIPANALLRANGEAPKDDVEVELTEYYKKSDILLANLHSASDTMLLETGGMINLVARSNGETLILKKGKAITILFSSKNKTQDMSVFLGTKHGKALNWKQQSKYESVAIRLSTNEFNKSAFQGRYRGNIADSLLLNANSFGWINCDRFARIELKTNMTVLIDSAYHAELRLVFKDINAIMPAVNLRNDNYSINNIPIGQKATLIAFGRLKETLYFITKDIVITENLAEKLILKKTTAEELPMLLKKLN